MKIILKNNPVPYDNITIGGHKYIFGTDIKIGKNLGKTLSNLKGIVKLDGYNSTTRKVKNFKKFIFDLYKKEEYYVLYVRGFVIREEMTESNISIIKDKYYENT